MIDVLLIVKVVTVSSTEHVLCLIHYDSMSIGGNNARLRPVPTLLARVMK